MGEPDDLGWRWRMAQALCECTHVAFEHKSVPTACEIAAREYGNDVVLLMHRDLASLYLDGCDPAGLP